MSETPPPSTNSTPAEIIADLQGRLPEHGLFQDRSWVPSPEPFALSKSQVRQLQQLGNLLAKFVACSDDAYRRSLKGSLPEWISSYLDAGKPEFLRELGRSTKAAPELPMVIRPDLLVTADGFAITELDSVPGGIGLTDFLHQFYSDHGHDLVGGRDGMRDGFASILPDGGDIVISDESADYRPEMEWLSSQLGADRYPVFRAEDYEPKVGRRIYRFFELFDHANIPFLKNHAKQLASGEIQMVAPAKPHLEEKNWFGLFWRRQLREFWRRGLRDKGFRQLQELLPYSWIVDPAPIPDHAAIPKLDIGSWDEMGELGQKDRELVLKVSGFSELAWGSRGVWIGHDLPQDEWNEAVQNAIKAFPEGPRALQEFRPPVRVDHPVWDTANQQVATMDGRVRLCPYYFVVGGKANLGGVLATIVPADKKVVHGMSDSTLVPCVQA